MITVFTNGAHWPL